MSEAVALSARAAADLRRRILTGGLAPGERLPTEATLMDELGVGRSTLREAVRVLEREGLVRVRQGSGTYVAQPDRAELLAAALGAPEREQITEVRRMLEPEIARMAAERRTPDQAREILRLAVRRATFRTAGDVEGLVEADLDLHRAVATATNNPVLRDLYDAFARVLSHLVAHAIQDGGSDFSAEQHDRLAASVAVGDADDAESAVHAILDEKPPSSPPFVT